VDANVPYLPSVANLHKILAKIQNAGVPEIFNIDFLKDLGFTSSNDRPVIKIFKYIGLLDQSGRPQTAYREFVDHTKAKKVLAARLRAAFDDLYLSDREAHTRTVESLKGWFKTKTGEGDAVAKKIATTFRSLAQYADFSGQPSDPLPEPTPPPPTVRQSPPSPPAEGGPTLPIASKTELGLVYRLEIHLPDTQNVETFRAIFKALREELMP
jgi:Family of unknown function (DUF5343)